MTHIDFSGALKPRGPNLLADVVIDGARFEFWEIGSYYSDDRARFLSEIEVRVGHIRRVLPRAWLLSNTYSWRDYTPDDFYDPAPCDAWSHDWKARAVQAVISDFSAHV